MVDNKKQRKSTRSFNMEKHVERHFEIEKEELPVGDTSLKKLDEVSDGASSGETPGTSNNRGKLIAGAVVILAVLAFVAYRSCSSGYEQNLEPTNTVVSDSIEKENADTVSSVKKTSDSENEKMQANDDNGNVGTPTTSYASESTTEPRTASSSQKSIEEKVMQVWDGIYGNGTERKSKLGSDYQAVQKRVNEMYRNGYRH